MKRKIIFGAVLAAFLMLMMPAISAENGKTLDKNINEPEINNIQRKIPSLLSSKYKLDETDFWVLVAAFIFYILGLFTGNIDNI